MSSGACLVLSLCCLPFIIAQSCSPEESKELRTNCIDKYLKSSDVCAGRGNCVCGVCECAPRRRGSAERYSGQYCECDDYSCSFINGMMCGGPERGLCKCGYCICVAGYTGPACNCPTGNTTCLDPQGKVCNGHGSCNCGVCKCQKPYKGDFCQDCPDCTGSCESYKECVLCRMFKSGSYGAAECESKCSSLPITGADKLDVDISTEKLCTYKQEDNCEVQFSYALDFSEVTVLRSQVCQKPSSTATKLIPFEGVLASLLPLSLIHIYMNL